MSLFSFAIRPLTLAVKRARFQSPQSLTAHQRGYDEYGSGKPNPFPSGTIEATEWDAGHKAAHEYWAW